MSNVTSLNSGSAGGVPTAPVGGFISLPQPQKVLLAVKKKKPTRDP